MRAATGTAPAASLFAIPCTLLAVAALSLAPSPVLADAPENTVLLPAAAARFVDGGAAGWTASAQVTAAGCGALGCPTASGAWVADAGAEGLGDGALVSTLAHVGAGSGVASVVWRSPLFLAPPAPGSASLRLGIRVQHAWPASAAAGITYSARLITPSAGTSRTLVDGAPTSTPALGWTNVAPVFVPIGVLGASTLNRLEIEVRFPVSAQATGDASVALDQVTLEVDGPALTAVPTSPVPALPVAGLPLAPGSSGAGQSEGPEFGTDAAESAPVDPAATPGAVLARCQDEDIVLLGASALARRVSVVGAVDRDAGTRVDLLSEDGWRLGRATVRADGAFAATLREPRASQGTRSLFARLPDGERSPAVPVERRNVLRAVHRSGRTLVVDGTVARSLGGRGRLTVDVEVPAGDPCDRPQTLRAAKVRFDASTGRYRATVQVPAGTGGSASVATDLVRTRVSRGGSLTRLTAPSQLIFGSPSGRGTP